MVRRCEFDGSTHSTANLCHFLRIRGDHGFIQDLHSLDPSPYPLDEGPAEKGVEGLVGEAGRGEPGWDDAQNPAAHRRHPAPKVGPCDAIFTPVKVEKASSTGKEVE
jgi:hypothetical protein